jgi:hypothetical protein
LLINWKLQSTLDWNEKIFFLSLVKVTLKIYKKICSLKRKEKSKKILFILKIGKKTKASSLETKYNILWDIEKGSKTKTEIAKDFQIKKKNNKKTLGYLVFKGNKWHFFLIKWSSNWRTMLNNQFTFCKFVRNKNAWYKELIRYMLTRNSEYKEQILNVPNEFIMNGVYRNSYLLFTLIIYFCVFITS